MDNIDNEYIGNATDELINFVGIKEEVSVRFLLKPLYAGNVKGCIENIANYLGLPIAVNLLYSDKFESRALATTDRTGRGVEGITAQVSIPSYLPFYGTAELQGFPITVKVSHNCKNYPLTFLAIMAHELSHILLHSLWHKEKDNEIYTDLTAMLLGFSEVMEEGRKIEETRNKGMYTETHVATYGYFSDTQFNFAYNRISEIRKETINLKKELPKKLTTFRKQLSSYKKELFLFSKFLEYLDKNQNKRIKKEDAPKLVLFHQLGYTDKFIVVVRRNEEKNKEINNFCLGLRNHTQQRLNLLRKFDREIDTLISDLKSELDLLNNDVSTLRKYVGFFYRRNISRQCTLVGGL